MKALLELKDIVFSWPDTEEPVLSGLSLCLRQGEILGLLGGNGSGKSTLMHVAAGLLRPVSGYIFHNGQECVEEKDFVLLRRSLGYLLQHSENQLFCPTVLEDVAFGPVNRGMDEAQALEMAQGVLERMGLAHLADRAGATLSGGEQKLAALATLLAMEPDFLFLDEPTNDLDRRARHRLSDILLEQDLPMLIISHDRFFLQTHCTTFCRLHDGAITSQAVDLSEVSESWP